MKYPAHLWKQIKNVTARELIAALQKDGWTLDAGSGAQQVYRAEDGRRVSIHYHSHKTYGAKLLKALLEDIGWTARDMQKLKLIK